MEVLLGDVVLAWLHPLVITGQEDPYPLAVLFRFHDESLGSPFVELLLERFLILGQYPRGGEEIVFIRDYLLD